MFVIGLMVTVLLTVIAGLITQSRSDGESSVKVEAAYKHAVDPTPHSDQKLVNGYVKERLDAIAEAVKAKPAP